jgi:hypothetical protein
MSQRFSESALPVKKRKLPKKNAAIFHVILTDSEMTLEVLHKEYIKMAILKKLREKEKRYYL